MLESLEVDPSTTRPYGSTTSSLLARGLRPTLLAMVGDSVKPAVYLT